ncbi:protein involved in detoxification of methylglyoxal [Escherichia coli]|nr:protein involved in detoxification of methylglyoxal [Escherichia coli]
MNLVPFGLSASDWKVHRGDLVVEGNIESNQKLIVLGNLTVKGNISTFSLSNPWVILGNVTATNIVTDSPLLITGSINASGLVLSTHITIIRLRLRGVLMRVGYLSMT